MDIKRETCDIQTWEKAFTFRHILHQHWYTCPIALPVRRNQQHRSLLTVVSATSAAGRALSATFECPWENLSTQLWTALSYRQFSLYIGNIYLWISFALSPFCQKKKKRPLLFGSVHLKHGRHFDLWIQPVNMRMRVCYLGCHEAGLCCYLVIHIEKLLQLFYFHLWPI
jgi:hypothetical protein